jgi:hypothetical protein
VSSQEVCFLFVFRVGHCGWGESREVGTRVFLSPQWMWLLRDRQVGQITALVGLSVENGSSACRLLIGIRVRLDTFRSAQGHAVLQGKGNSNQFIKFCPPISLNESPSSIFHPILLRVLPTS